jgi:hypothetical protein
LAVTLEIADATLGGLAFGVGMTTYSHKVELDLFINFLNLFFRTFVVNLNDFIRSGCTKRRLLRTKLCWEMDL